MQMGNANATLCAACIHSIDIQSERRAYYIGGTFFITQRAAEHVNANAHISKMSFNNVRCRWLVVLRRFFFCSSWEKSAACTLQKCHVCPPCRAHPGKITNAEHNDGSMKCKTPRFALAHCAVCSRFRIAHVLWKLEKWSAHCSLFLRVNGSSIFSVLVKSKLFTKSLWMRRSLKSCPALWESRPVHTYSYWPAAGAACRSQRLAMCR
jgi:hypothetical protein